MPRSQVCVIFAAADAANLVRIPGSAAHLPQMERAAVIAFAVLLLLILLFWTYGYIRRRSKKRF